MKRTISLLLVLMLALGLTPSAFAKTGVQNGGSLTIIKPRGGPYIIVTEVTPDNITLKYGYHNLKNFESAPLSYEIRIDYRGRPEYYTILNERNSLDPAPIKLGLAYSFVPRYPYPAGEYFFTFIIYCEDDSHEYYGLRYRFP